MIQFCGLPGVGKTTIASFFHSNIENAEFFSVRNMRRKLGHDRYLPERNQEVFEALYSEMSQAMLQKKTVIFDSNETQHLRRMHTANFASQHRYDFLNIECFCHPEIARKRIQTRELVQDELFEDSDNPDVFNSLQERWQPIGQKELELSNYYFMRIDTELNKIEVVKSNSLIKNYIKKSYLFR
jgi:predicted kinase